MNFLSFPVTDSTLCGAVLCYVVYLAGRVGDRSVELSFPPFRGDVLTLRSQVTRYLESTLSDAWPEIVPGPVKIADVALSVGSVAYVEAVARRAKLASAIDEAHSQIENLKAKGKCLCFDKWLIDLTYRVAEWRYKRVEAIIMRLVEKEEHSLITRIFVTFCSKEGLLRCMRDVQCLDLANLKKHVAVNKTTSTIESNADAAAASFINVDAAVIKTSEKSSNADNSNSNNSKDSNHEINKNRSVSKNVMNNGNIPSTNNTNTGSSEEAVKQKGHRRKPTSGEITPTDGKETKTVTDAIDQHQDQVQIESLTSNQGHQHQQISPQKNQQLPLYASINEDDAVLGNQEVLAHLKTAAVGILGTAAVDFGSDLEHIHEILLRLI